SFPWLFPFFLLFSFRSYFLLFFFERAPDYESFYFLGLSTSPRLTSHSFRIHLSYSQSPLT
ncbi:uncharacterized protein BDR25DRAFT_346042, partial [Lindgomyces ingoldianus]